MFINFTCKPQLFQSARPPPHTDSNRIVSTRDSNWRENDQEKGQWRGKRLKRKDGRVVGVYEDANGKTKYITSKTMSKAEMKAVVRKKLEDRDNGVAFDAENLTVAEYIERWLESTKDTVGFKTYQRSEETARPYITPTLGKTKLEKLSAMQLDGLYRKKLEKSLSPRSVQIIHATAHNALKQAIRWQMLRTNVAEHATPPKSTKRRDMLVLTVEQSQILLRTAERNQPHFSLYVSWP